MSIANRLPYIFEGQQIPKGKVIEQIDIFSMGDLGWVMALRGRGWIVCSTHKISEGWFLKNTILPQIKGTYKVRDW